MKKRMVSLLLVCCLVLALLPTIASAGMFETPTVLEVGGTSVIEGGYWKTTADGKLTTDGASASDYNVAYTAGTKNLTLNGATIKGFSWSRYGVVGRINQAGIWAGIHTDGTINLILNGDNTVDLTGLGKFNADCAGIAVGNEYQDITFSGSGDLVVKSGEADGQSFGLLSYGAVTMSGTGTVKLLGGECAYNKTSAGIYNMGSLEDNHPDIVPRTGKLIAGTDFGGASSFGVYGKMLLSEWNYNIKGVEYEGDFTAYCGEAELAVALSLPPLYSPAGSSVLMGSENRTGAGYVVYDAVDNGLYTYVNVEHDLKTGASIDASSFAELEKTPYTITVKAASIDGSNPGDQEIEYALGSYNANLPSIGWQKETLFTGLTPHKTYMVYARTAATTEYAPGPAKAIAIATPVDAVTDDNDVSVYTGLSVDGIAIDKSKDLACKPVGDDAGWMSYDSATRTLTLGGTVTITHGCQTIGYGEAVGIYSNAELHIVLADGAVVNINMKNYARDRDLVTNLETSTTLTGRCYGILNYGDLTIDAAEDCMVTPQLNINVLGAASAFGIYAKEVRDASSAVLEDGDVTIGAVDTNITVRGMTGPVTINPSILYQQANGYPNVTGISSGDDITLNGTTGADEDSSTQYHVQTVGGYNGHLFTAGATGYGVVQMNGGYVYAQNNARNGNYRVSYNTIKWALGYTCTDSEGNRVEMKDAYWVNGSADFDPNGEPVLKGDLVITGTLEKDYKLTATIKNGNLSSADTPNYQWYRYRYGTETEIKGATEATYKLTSVDVDYQFYCVVTCDGYAGSLVSAMTDKVVSGAYVPTVYIAGVLLTKQNAADVLKDSGVFYEGKISYDPTTNVLTLDNVTLSDTGGQSAIIFSDGDYEGFTINLVGKNTLSTTVAGKMAISCEAVMFTGDGSLYAHADYPSKATIHAPWQLDIGGNCSIVTSCINNNTVTASASNMTNTELGALNAGDLIVSGNSSIYAYVDDGEDGNSKCSAIDVSYTTTIKDNATVVAKGSRHEAFVTGYLTIEGGSVKAENVGTGFQYTYGQNRVKIETAQYPALKVTNLNLAMYGIKNIPKKLTISNAKLEVYSELGYGILEQETGVHSEKIDEEWDDNVHTVLADNFEIYNSTVTVRLGSEVNVSKTAPIVMEDTDGGTIIAENCTVYAGTDETGADAALSTKDAFLTKGNRYIRLHEGTAVDVSVESAQSGAIDVSIAVGPQAETDAPVMIARYNAAGKLMEVKYRSVALSGDIQTVSAAFNNAAADDTYKVFILDGTRYVPLKSAIRVS